MLYSLLDTLIMVSVIGAAIDVPPWFAYDISETGQKSMIRVIRIRTIVEDRKAQMGEDSAYIEGCEALLKAEKYFGKEKLEMPDKSALKSAKLLPSSTKEEQAARHAAITAAKKEIDDAKSYNEEIEIADFVMHEINRFKDDFGKKQLELANLIVSGGPQHFYECSETAMSLAYTLPQTHIKEEKQWRKQDIRNARALAKSEKLAAKHYPDGVVEFDQQIFEDAYNLPDDTKQLAKIRRKAMKAANKQKNLYGTVAGPYLAAKRILDLAEGYANLDSITSDYEDVVERRNLRHDAERAEALRIAQERKADKERKEAEKRIRRK